LLYQARATTQEHSAQITTYLPGDGKPWNRTKNKVPYMIACLESLVGVRPFGEDSLLAPSSSPASAVAGLTGDPAAPPSEPDPSSIAEPPGYLRLKDEVDHIRRQNRRRQQSERVADSAASRGPTGPRE
jgi:hypothetical protein